MTKKIKVTIKKEAYYDAVEGKYWRQEMTAAQLAAFDQHLFRENEISWDDLFDREDVIFEGVDD